MVSPVDFLPGLAPDILSARFLILGTNREIEMARLLPIIIGFVICIAAALILALYANSKEPDA